MDGINNHKRKERQMIDVRHCSKGHSLNDDEVLLYAIMRTCIQCAEDEEKLIKERNSDENRKMAEKTI